jgi:hypothetical protein
MFENQEDCIRVVQDQCVDCSRESIVEALQKVEWKPLEAILLLLEVPEKPVKNMQRTFLDEVREIANECDEQMHKRLVKE